MLIHNNNTSAYAEAVSHTIQE